MAKVDKSKFNNLTTGIQFPNKLIITGGDDTGRAINANQIEWGTSEFLGSALTEGTTEEVLTRIENTQTTYENVWEDYVEPITTGTFYIDETPYTYTVGMTFSDWIESTYNTQYPNARFDDEYSLVLDPEADYDGIWEYKYFYIEVDEDELIESKVYEGHLTDFI